jgi:hypothetical protein
MKRTPICNKVALSSKFQECEGKIIISPTTMELQVQSFKNVKKRPK